MKTGLNQFSYHRFYGDVFPSEIDPGHRWTLRDFLDRAQVLDVQQIALHTHYLTEDNISNLSKLLMQFDLSCILEWGHPEGLKMGTSPEAVADLRRWFSVAQAVECRLMRIVAGYPTWRGQEPLETQMDRLVPILKELCCEAEEKGLTLAIENHADFTPDELITLVDRVDHKTLRICFDTGNCVRLGADLIKSARRIAPSTAMVHLKDLKILEASIGDPNALWPSAPLGEGSMDIRQALNVLHRHGFEGPVFIEMAAMHPDWPDEQQAVAQSVNWLYEYIPFKGS